MRGGIYSIFVRARQSMLNALTHMGEKGFSSREVFFVDAKESWNFEKRVSE